MKVLCRTGIVLTSLFSSVTIIAAERVIYGIDDRKEVYDTENNPTLVELADSTAILVEDSKITRKDGAAKLPSGTFKTSMRVCDGERFSEQINPGFCSGFLVGPDLFVTAGHCITDASKCAKTSMIFDFALTSKDRDLSTVAEGEVYHCKQIVKRVLEGNNNDFAVVRLDRPVSGHRPLQIRREGEVNKGEKIAVIGHPVGLPTKISDGAVVRENAANKAYFVANLDTYGGGTGSAGFYI